MIRYKILWTKMKAHQRYVMLMDFHEGQTIEFSMDEVDRDKLPKDVKAFVRENLEKIKKGYWDYTQ